MSLLLSIIFGILMGVGLGLPLFDVGGWLGPGLFASGLIGIAFTTQSRSVRSAFAVLALAVSAVCVFVLVERSSLAKWRHDFTEDKLYTLTDGTQQVLAHIDDPVTIRLYVTRQSEQAPQTLKRYIQRVDSLLDEYQTLAPDGIRIIEYSPEPDTEAADAASLDGMRPLALEAGEFFYLGLSVSCLDRKVSFPRLDPAAANSLETELSQAIASVSQPRDFKIGLMSSLYLQGSPNVSPAEPAGKPWYLHEQLRQSFDAEMVPMGVREIPDEIDLLFLIHPSGITPATEYAVEQFVLRGGTLIACLDAFSVEALLSNGPVGLRGGGLSSTLPTLLPHWGIGFTDQRCVADPTYRSKLQGGRTNLSLLTLTDAAVDEQSPFTTNLRDMLFVFPGGFFVTEPSKFEVTHLIRASDQAGLVDPQRAYNFDPKLATELQPATRQLADGSTEPIALSLALELKGEIQSAFPDGPPPQQEKKPNPLQLKTAAKQEPAESAPSATKPHLASGKGRVFLIGDVDAFGNNTGYRPTGSQGGNTSVAYANDNVSLLLNILDRISGSEYLIDARKTVSQRRPFLVFNEIERLYDQKFGAKEVEIEKEINDTQIAIAKLQSLESDPNQAFMSPEQEAELVQARNFIAGKQREKRLLRRELKSAIDREENRIFMLNLLAVPTFILIFAILFLGIRYRLTSAR